MIRFSARAAKLFGNALIGTEPALLSDIATLSFKNIHLNEAQNV